MSSNDPAWDMPTINWQQQGSFASGQLPTLTDPDAGTPVCIGPFAREWLPFVLGAMDQLRNPSSWIVASDAVMEDTLARVDRLREIFGDAGDCVTCPLIRLEDCVLQSSCDGGATWTDVTGWAANFATCVQTNAPVTTPPPNPGAYTPDMMGCAIAGYLATEIIQISMQKAVDAILGTRTALQYAEDVILSIPGFYWSSLFVTAVNLIYGEISGGTLSDYESAMSDPALFVDVQCAIYNAIKVDGAITIGNFASILTNISAISYVHAGVVTTIHDFVNAMGWNGLAVLSQPAGLNPSTDCSSCAGWCYWYGVGGDEAGFASWLTNPGTGTYVSGMGWQSQGSGTDQSLAPYISFASTTITSIEVYFTATSDKGGGSREISVGPDTAHLSGLCALNGGTGTFENFCTDGNARGAIYIAVDSSSGSGVGINTLHWVKIRGTGSNPFGTTNCV